jgi:hypothetical protein
MWDEFDDHRELMQGVANDEVLNRPAEEHLRLAADMYRWAYVPGKPESHVAGARATADLDHTAIQTELLWAIAKRLPQDPTQ